MISLNKLVSTLHEETHSLYVLCFFILSFACVCFMQNWKMAEGWARHIAKNDLEIWSSGLEGSRVHPTAKVCVAPSLSAL